MHIIDVINQHHCDKIKDYLHVDHQILKKSTFNTLKFVYGYYLFFLWQVAKIIYFTMLGPIHIMVCNVCFNRNNTSLEVDCKGHNQGYDERL
jgi:hypothetical protein